MRRPQLATSTTAHFSLFACITLCRWEEGDAEALIAIAGGCLRTDVYEKHSRYRRPAEDRRARKHRRMMLELVAGHEGPARAAWTAACARRGSCYGAVPKRPTLEHRAVCAWALDHMGRPEDDPTEVCVSESAMPCPSGQDPIPSGHHHLRRPPCRCWTPTTPPSSRRRSAAS